MNLQEISQDTISVMNLQEFNLRMVRLRHPEDIEEYFSRDSGYIHGTPKIIIKSHNQLLVSVYVQKLGDCFSTHLWKMYNEITILDKLEVILITIIQLRNKYGCFRIYQNLIRVCSNQLTKVWIHQDPTLNYRQYPLISDNNSQSIMVAGLIKLFQPLIKQFYNLLVPQSLQSFHMYIKNMKQSNKLSKRTSIERIFYTERKSIKSFIQIPMIKPTSSYYTTIKDDHQISDINHKINHRNLTNCSFQITKHAQTSFQNPFKKYFNQTPKKNIDHKPKSVNFTYSSPLSRPSYQESKVLILPLIQQHNQSNIKYKKNDFEIKQKDFNKPKFPHSTQSTLVTLKDTKSFNDINFDLPIQQEEKSESNNKQSSKGKSITESRCDIENELQNLFVADKSSSNNEQQFSRRQLQFEEILFS